jgi:hypothetical protein
MDTGNIMKSLDEKFITDLENRSKVYCTHNTHNFPGIFNNTDRQHNGKLFLSQYFEEDGEIYNEKIFLSLNNNIK